MKRMFLAVALCVAAAFSGCATSPQTPQQSVYAATSAYAGVLSVAVAYKNLPACTSPAKVVVCSDATVVKQLQAADTTAYSALQAAQNVVRAPGVFGFNVQSFINTANEALVAFTSIATSLRTK